MRKVHAGRKRRRMLAEAEAERDERLDKERELEAVLRSVRVGLTCPSCGATIKLLPKIHHEENGQAE